MFSGIIRAMAEVGVFERQSGSLMLSVTLPLNWKIRVGDSIAVNGVCLTAKEVLKKTCRVELMRETLDRTTFGRAIPKLVNLERPLKLSDFLDGHLVQGHVDTTGGISNIESGGTSIILTVEYPRRFSHLVVEKGSIAVNGVSLTVVDSRRGRFTVSLVTFTLEHTTFGMLKRGDSVNLEFDIIAKHLYRFYKQNKT